MLHTLQYTYHMSASDVLWHDWEWINERLEKIHRDRNYDKRWALMSQAASTALAFHGSDAKDAYDGLIDLTFTDAEKARQAEEEEARQLEILEQQRKQRLAQMGLLTG